MNHTVTISKLKHYPAMSEETPCFSCDVLLDGKKTWTAKNDGHGGQTLLYYVKPTTVSGEHDANAIIDIVDKFVSDAIIDKAKSKDLKITAKRLASAIYFRVEGQRAGAYYCVKTKNPSDTELRKKIFKEAKVEVIINDLPLNEAVNYFFRYV
jgi:hypothetical protein